MIFPIPKYENYGSAIYDLKEYDDNLNLVDLYEKYKSGNSDVKVDTDVTFSEDEYALVINENGITITVAYDSGLFRAITTLKQLIKHDNFTAILFIAINNTVCRKPSTNTYW